MQRQIHQDCMWNKGGMEMEKQNIVYRCLIEVCDELLAKKDELNELDAVMGDGEHGSNIERTFGQVKSQLPDMETLTGTQIIDKTGTILLAAGGGTATTLMGFACKKTAILLKNTEQADEKSVAEVMKKVQESIKAKSKAEVGDKTLMDAYIPAVEAFTDAAKNGMSLPQCFSNAAEAAGRGVEATKDMIAKRGRGYYVGERGLGVCDPGATSIATIFYAIAKILAKGEA